MSEKYEIHSTSSQSAVVDGKELSSTATTRLFVLPEIVENEKNPDAKVKITLVHQRKTPSGAWENEASPSLAKLTAGEARKFHLDSKETLTLHRELLNLFAIGESEGVKSGERSLVVAPEDEVIVTDANHAGIIKSLLSKGYSDEVWRELVQADPDLVTRLSYAQIHAQRKAVLEEFRQYLAQKQGEDWWQDFFERNKWIFGYGLRYQILRPVQSQPHYGGQTLAGKGTEKGDYLQCTEAQVKFTVLVEIKKPDTSLLGIKQYRNAAWQLAEDLTGGVAQLQANCRRWEIEGSQTEKNREDLSKKEIFTVQPKGILVIGNTGQLTDLAKRNTFELFRRNILNPEILTFDELYERAKFIVEHTAQKRMAAAEEPPDEDPFATGEDNIPF